MHNNWDIKKNYIQISYIRASKSKPSCVCSVSMTLFLAQGKLWLCSLTAPQMLLDLGIRPPPVSKCHSNKICFLHTVYQRTVKIKASQFFVHCFLLHLGHYNFIEFTFFATAVIRVFLYDSKVFALNSRTATHLLWSSDFRGFSYALLHHICSSFKNVSKESIVSRQMRNKHIRIIICKEQYISMICRAFQIH